MVPLAPPRALPVQITASIGGGAAADASSKVLCIASEETAELKTSRQVDRSLTLEALTVLTGPGAGILEKGSDARSTVRRFEPGLCSVVKGLVEGVVETLRRLTGYKWGSLPHHFYPSIFLEHKPSVIMVKALAKQNGGVEV